MAKEVIAGETVGSIDDDGPEEGEIEDDTSEEDGSEKKFCSSHTPDVNTSVGMKYYQASSSSKSESHAVKPKIYSHDKKQLWRNSKRRIYNFYVDHDKPSRDSYNRLTKSDLNSDHREINFHDLLKDYRTSKQGNEGNPHEKENRHYPKEVRTDPPRKHESGLIESPEDKLKRSRKRKQHRSPSRERNASVSSDTDGVRKRKELRNTKQKKNRKIPPRNRNLRESAALFAKIRASKLKAAAVLEKQKSQADRVQSDIENATEVSELRHSDVGNVVSEAAVGKCDESLKCDEGQGEQKEPCQNENESNKALCSVSDSQTADKNEDSESKDEEDDVNQLRMLALQSAFRAKYLERKRRGIIVRKQPRRSNHVPSKGKHIDSSFNLDDTADLLEAAVEEAVSSSVSKENLPSATENWQPTLFSSLSDVPLPPDDPPMPSPVEDLTPVDMELALTDDEENDNPFQNDGNNLQSENIDLYHSRVRTNRSLSKVSSIPVTIGGRLKSSKSRKRAINSVEDTRSNLLEVRTCNIDGQVIEDLNSSFVSMADVNLDSMILLDEVGTCSSPEVGPRMEEEQTLSEASDAKSDFVQDSSNQACFSGNADDEDEELLRAKLLIEISRRHMVENLTSNKMLVEEKGCDQSIVDSSVNEIVPVHVATEELESVLRPGGKSLTSHVTNLQSGRGVKVPLKRSVERTRRGQLLARVRNRQVSIPNNVQLSVSPYTKSYLSKIAGRGKYQRVNQNRIVGGKKRIDGNLHVTVVGAANKAKSVSAVPHKQDRIVICLGEDSDESEDERQNALSKRVPPGNNLLLPCERPSDNPVEPSELLPICSSSNSAQKPVLDSQFPVASVSADFEKSVDRFLKEVRSVQESRLQDQPSSQDQQCKRENIVQKQIDFTGSGVISKANVPSLGLRVNSKANAKSAVPEVNLKANVAPATPKVAGITVKTKLEKQIVKAVSGVTPQAVRHLPPTQQEEYRRLKLQISILEELRKKRKAAAVLNASKRMERVIHGKNCESVAPSDTPKVVAQPGQLQKSNPVDKPLGNGDAKGSMESRKTIRSGATGTSCAVPTNGDDDEDVNLLREQLLRSRLHKKMNAMAEKSGLKPEVSPATKETIAHKSSVVLNSMDVAVELCGQENTETNVELLIKSATECVVDHVQKSATSPGRGISSSSGKIPEAASSTIPYVERIDLKDDSSKDVAIVSINCGKAITDSAKGDAIPSVSKARECHPVVENVPLGNSGVSEFVTQGEVPVFSVRLANGGEKIVKARDIAVQAEGISEVKTAATQASFVPPRSNPLMLPGARVASAEFPLEGNDARVSELAELEFQLLSERHAALQYLGELSSLLSKMETEGVHLRQKEMAAQKLRVELTSAESAIVAQKHFLKQLALTISSTHEKVTSTRQRCSILCQACARLGNQLKQDKRANGGKSITYQVPTGGAALVKSQLSSVLWQTKQLRKAGLPFLRGQNLVTSGKSPATKKVTRRAETSVVPWSNLSLQSLSLESLEVSSSNKSSLQPKGPHIGSSVTLGINDTSAPLINDPVVVNSTSKLKPTTVNPSANVPDVVRKVSPPVEKSVLTPGTFVLPSSHSAVASTVVSSSDSAKIKELCLLEKKPMIEVLKSKSVNVAKAPLSQPTKSVVNNAVNSDQASSEVVSSGSGEKFSPLKCVAGNGVQLRDYHSPLEPVTNRIHAENPAASSGSSLQLEESVMLDPNVILCPYDLMGECQDEECPYQHQRRKGVVKGS